MDVHADTKAYETWLATFGPVVAEDLAAKHKAMSETLFPFLRATFYRWCRLWPQVCPQLEGAPTVLAVGDLHVENFGTWRDAEGRLIWGVNDMDEAGEMPYALDLVRLVTSAFIALEGKSLSEEDIAEAILDGYRDGLAAGRPFVLAEDNGWLRELALGELRDPERFWKKVEALADVDPGDQTRALLLARLPAGATLIRISHRIAGLGSLGRRRFLALARYGGGLVAREIKTLCPSAWNWAHGRPDAAIRCADLVAAAVHCPDPFLAFSLDDDRRRGWVSRRLAPDCSRIELATLAHRREDRRLLKAMGRETANIHLGSPGAGTAILRDLAGRPKTWLRTAADAMEKATRADWKAWRDEAQR